MCGLCLNPLLSDLSAASCGLPLRGEASADAFTLASSSALGTVSSSA